MLDDPIFPQPAIDDWYRVTSVDDDDRFVRVDLECPEIARRIVPGQFVQVAPGTCGTAESHAAAAGWNVPLLNRPFSFHRWLPDRRGISILLDRVGPGTRAIAMVRPGEQLRFIGPLGHGMSEVPSNKKLFVYAAGGIGVAPFDAFAELASGTGIHSVMAYGVGCVPDLALRLGRHTRLADEMSRFGVPTYLASMSGEAGYHGTVVDLLREQFEGSEGCFARMTSREETLVIACGPSVMLKATARWAAECGLDCLVLMEEMMGCGYGVCRSCVVPGWTDANEAIRQPTNITTCRHGPLLDARLVDWDGSIS